MMHHDLTTMGPMMLVMGLVAVLALIAICLVAAAAIKYLFFEGRRHRDD